MAKPKITLYVDIVSPFAYYAFHILRNSPTFAECDITYVPILLGGIMQATGNRPPIAIKNKAAYVETQRVRWAQSFQIPVAEKTPSPFPQNTVTAQRALCAVVQTRPELLIPALEALYHTFWVERKTISEAEVVGAGLVSVLGESGAREVMAKTKDDEIKAMLKRNTDQAFADGCFGLPWLQCTNAKGERQSFWGVDHLGLVCEFLGLERKEEEPGLRSLL